MSRYWDDTYDTSYLEHSWGTSPKQKAAEKAYNARYYRTHKDKWTNKDSDSSPSDVMNSPDYYQGKYTIDTIKEKLFPDGDSSGGMVSQYIGTTRDEPWTDEDRKRSDELAANRKGIKSVPGPRGTTVEGSNKLYEDTYREVNRKKKLEKSAKKKNMFNTSRNGKKVTKHWAKKVKGYNGELEHYDDSLAHSWGKKPEQKAAEKAYNHKYYMSHKGKSLSSKNTRKDTDPKINKSKELADLNINK